jgi:polar amino acid transport system permease protein
MTIVGFIDWGTFFHYVWPPSAFHNRLIAHGIVVTLYVAVVAQTLGVAIGVVSAIGQLSRSRLARALVSVYVTYFRGTPLVVQLSLIYFGTASLGLYKFPDAHLLGVNAPGIVQAGILGLALNKGAFMTEIVRAGILSIDHGQTEAAQAIGMTRRQTMRWIVLPQAARVIVPPLGNEFNATLKDTSLLVVIGGVELFNAFQQLNGTLFQPFELFFAMSLYYLAMTICWSLVQARIERRLGRGVQVEHSPRLLEWRLPRIAGRGTAR